MSKVIGWWEEYRCGCVSETVKLKRELSGYCPKHGDDRRYAHKDIVNPWIARDGDGNARPFVE